MKNKVIALLIPLFLLSSLTGCNKKKDGKESTSEKDSTKESIDIDPYSTYGKAIKAYESMKENIENYHGDFTTICTVDGDKETFSYDGESGIYYYVKGELDNPRLMEKMLSIEQSDQYGILYKHSSATNINSFSYNLLHNEKEIQEYKPFFTVPVADLELISQSEDIFERYTKFEVESEAEIEMSMDVDVIFDYEVSVDENNTFEVKFSEEILYEYETMPNITMARIKHEFEITFDDTYFYNYKIKAIEDLYDIEKGTLVNDGEEEEAYTYKYTFDEEGYNSLQLKEEIPSTIENYQESIIYTYDQFGAQINQNITNILSEYSKETAMTNASKFAHGIIVDGIYLDKDFTIPFEGYDQILTTEGKLYAKISPKEGYELMNYKYLDRHFNEYPGLSEDDLRIISLLFGDDLSSVFEGYTLSTTTHAIEEDGLVKLKFQQYSGASYYYRQCYLDGSETEYTHLTINTKNETEHSHRVLMVNEYSGDFNINTYGLKDNKPVIISEGMMESGSITYDLRMLRKDETMYFKIDTKNFDKTFRVYTMDDKNLLNVDKLLENYQPDIDYEIIGWYFTQDGTRVEFSYVGDIETALDFDKNETSEVYVSVKALKNLDNGFTYIVFD